MTFPKLKKPTLNMLIERKLSSCNKFLQDTLQDILNSMTDLIRNGEAPNRLILNSKQSEDEEQEALIHHEQSANDDRCTYLISQETYFANIKDVTVPMYMSHKDHSEKMDELVDLVLSCNACHSAFSIFSIDSNKNIKEIQVASDIEQVLIQDCGYYRSSFYDHIYALSCNQLNDCSFIGDSAFVYEPKDASSCGVNIIPQDGAC